MIILRKSAERGHASHGWLDSYHTFSFADYYDPNFMGFRTLRVINEDRIAGGGGFPPHPHRDMEIITYMIEGALAHEDSMGNRKVIGPGEVQVMTAGTGVVHSEFNASEKESAHLLQIWILTNHSRLKPSYDQKNFRDLLSKAPLVLAASEGGRNGSVKINQDVNLYLGRLKKGELYDFKIAPGRYAWIQLVKGRLSVNDQLMNAGDGAAVSEENHLRLEAQEEAEFLVFDLN